MVRIEPGRNYYADLGLEFPSDEVTIQRKHRKLGGWYWRWWLNHAALPCLAMDAETATNVPQRLNTIRTATLATRRMPRLHFYASSRRLKCSSTRLSRESTTTYTRLAFSMATTVATTVIAHIKTDLVQQEGNPLACAVTHGQTMARSTHHRRRAPLRPTQNHDRRRITSRRAASVGNDGSSFVRHRPPRRLSRTPKMCLQHLVECERTHRDRSRCLLNNSNSNQPKSSLLLRLRLLDLSLRRRHQLLRLANTPTDHHCRLARRRCGNVPRQPLATVAAAIAVFRTWPTSLV